MSSTKRIGATFVVASSAILLVGLCVNLIGKGQGQQSNKTAKIIRKGAPVIDQGGSQPSPKELDDAATPVVDLNASNPTDLSAERIFKNSRYDRHGLVKSEVDPRVAEVLMEPQDDLSDVPTDESDLVVEGLVTDSAAFLSNDKQSVYSEFTVRVGDILKSGPGLSVNRGESITTERFGGRVKQSDGRIIRYGVIGQGSPVKGEKYLFFLSKTEHGNYRILTGYQLQGTKVIPLDGTRISRRAIGSSTFDKHNDESYQAFSEEVRRALQNPKNDKQKRRVGP
jgi:hypothetical protein